MNTLLKACLKEVCDLVATGRAIASKAGIATLLPLMVQDGEDVPLIIANWSDLKPELEALLANPASDADLLAYVSTLVAGQGGKAEAIVAASCKLLLDFATVIGPDIAALEAAIKAPTPAPAA